MQISAAVVQEVGGPFTLRDVDLQAPAPDEVVVQIAGAGICHTDIAVQHGHLPFPLPGVLGHEGSGTVVQVGADVTSIAVGDDVAISFNSCGACPTCSKGQPAYCHNFLEYNFGGVRSDGSSGLAAGGTKLGANFFGQSSLATHALAHERNVVKLPPDAPVELVGPLGCGIQTGAGAVLNSLDVQPGATVVIAAQDPTRRYLWPTVEWTGTYFGPTDATSLDASTAFDTSLPSMAMTRLNRRPDQDDGGAELFHLDDRFHLGTVTHPPRRPNPDRAGFFHHRQKCRCKTTGHGLIGLAARYTVRNDDEVHRNSLLMDTAINSHSSIWFRITLSTN